MHDNELDTIDRKILNELSRDARTPVSTLALKVGLSRQATRQRIDRLEAHGVIAAYTIRQQRPRGSESMVPAVIQVYRKDRMRGSDVTRAIAAIPEVTYCAVLSGDIDLLLTVEARSHERINEIWSAISSLPGVENTKTHFVLSSVVDRRHP
jgi:DNA-binding Lrp family transcriptional regulator